MRALLGQAPEKEKKDQKKTNQQCLTLGFSQAACSVIESQVLPGVAVTGTVAVPQRARRSRDGGLMPGLPGHPSRSRSTKVLELRLCKAQLCHICARIGCRAVTEMMATNSRQSRGRSSHR